MKRLINREQLRFCTKIQLDTDFKNCVLYILHDKINHSNQIDLQLAAT